jgi:hypothetical protein
MNANTNNWKCKYYEQLHNQCHQNHSSLDKNEKFKHQLDVPMSSRRYLLCLTQKGVGATFAIGLLKGKSEDTISYNICSKIPPDQISFFTS